MAKWLLRCGDSVAKPKCGDAIAHLVKAEKKVRTVADDRVRARFDKGLDCGQVRDIGGPRIESFTVDQHNDTAASISTYLYLLKYRVERPRSSDSSLVFGR